MTTLREAAQQALEALEGGADSWQRVGPAIDALKAVLAEPVQEPVRLQCTTCGTVYADGVPPQVPVREPVQEPQGCDHCNHPLYAATKCRVCGRVTEVVQEPVAWLTPGQDLHLNNGEGFRFSDWTPLYAAPPQRKPLAEWQINDLMADIDPEDRDSWSFRQGVYAAEKHHGVRK